MCFVSMFAPQIASNPKKDDAAFEAGSQLYVDPDSCIDCGACVPVRTSNSIHPADDLSEEQKRFVQSNAAFYY
jgi:ferredoxin